MKPRISWVKSINAAPASIQPTLAFPFCFASATHGCAVQFSRNRSCFAGQRWPFATGGGDVDAKSAARRSERDDVIRAADVRIIKERRIFQDRSDWRLRWSRHRRQIVRRDGLQVFKPRQFLLRQRLPDGLRINFLEVLENNELGLIALLATRHGQLIAGHSYLDTRRWKVRL